MRANVPCRVGSTTRRCLVGVGSAGVVLLLGAATVALTAQQAPPALVTSADILAGLPADGSRWLTFGGNYTNQRHSPLTQLTPANVSRLIPQWTSLEPLPNDAALKLKFTIPAEQTGSLGIDANLFPYDPQHQTFINIYEGDKLRQQLIFNATSNEYVYYLGTTQGTLAVMRTFIQSGIHHIMIGPDHILFLIGLLLLGGTWKTLLGIVTAFTVGHSITLSLAALNVVTPPCVDAVSSDTPNCQPSGSLTLASTGMRLAK